MDSIKGGWKCCQNKSSSGLFFIEMALLKNDVDFRPLLIAVEGTKTPAESEVPGTEINKQF